MVALQVLATQGSEIGWTNPDHPGPGCDRRSRRSDVLQGRDHNSQSVRQLRALSQLHLHGGDDFEFPAERCGGDAVGVDDARAAWRRSVGSESRDADPRLRHRDCRLHPRRRKAAAEVRGAQTDDLGKPDRRAIDRDADADQPVDRTVHDAGGRRVHALRFGPGVLRDALDRCGALEPARRPGRIRIRHLQDGVVTRRLVRCRDLSRGVYCAQRRRGNRLDGWTA